MADRVQITKRGRVAHVELNRPEKLNALDMPMFEALLRAGEWILSESGVRAVVLSGAGRAFCAGLDFGSFLQMGQASTGRPRLLDRVPGKPGNLAQRVAWIWQEVPVPVIAAVHGVAFGGGLQIALGADIRVAAPDARLSIMEIRWGLIPDMSGTQTLRRLLRLDVAKELTFTGRIVSGEEAAQLGLVTRCAADPLGAAFALAEEIAEKSPHAVRSAKKLWNRAVEVGLAEGLELEEQMQLQLIGSPNQLEAVRANLEKRSPEFVDP
jgi:enoyl-CoA hydratase/carnithine racemase